MQDFEIPKGATPVDPTRSVLKTASQDFQIPKGAMLVGEIDHAPKSTPTSQEKKQQKKVSSTREFVVPMGATPVNATAVFHQKVYDDTRSQGYSHEQAMKRQHEYDYAVNQGLSPENAVNLASSVSFDTAEKHTLSSQERMTVFQQAKKHADEILERNRSTPISDNSTLNTEASKIVAAGGPDAWAKEYTSRYATSRSKGYSEEESVAHAGGEIDERVYDILRNTGLGSEHSYLFSEKGERDIRFAIAKTADSLEKSGHPYVGAILQGMSEFGMGLTTPSMVAIGVATKGAGAFSKVEPFAEEEVAGESGKATSLVGRMRRAYRAAKATAAAAPGKAAVAAVKQAGKTYARVAPESAASAAERVEKATAAIRAAKLPVSAVAVARTINEATHIYFSSQMSMGAMQGAKQFGTGVQEELEKTGAVGEKSEGANLSEKAIRAYGGDYSKPVAALLINTVIGGLMAYGGARGIVEEANFKIKADAMTDKLYGTPAEVEGEGPKEKSASKFSDLNDYQQTVVLTKMIEDDPAYNHAWVETKKEHDRRMRKLNYRYNANLRHAWNPDAVKRTARHIDNQMAYAEWEDAARSHYLKQITNLLHASVEARQELAEDEEARRTSAREGRPVRKTEAARKREEEKKVVLSTAEQVENARQGVAEARVAADRDTEARESTEVGEKPTEAPTRFPDEVKDDEGYVSYRGQVFGGEEHHFGVAQSEDGKWGVYRRTPDGIEYLGAGGVFEGDPKRPFVALDESTAKTLAQITSLRVNADYAIQEHGTTPERKAEQNQLRNLERQLTDGEITGEQARKNAGLPGEKSEEPAKPIVDQEIEAARAGVLNGPLHGKTRGEFEDSYLSELESAGWSPEDIEAEIGTIGPTLRMEAENNLHYVGKSGDWIASKKGSTWILDENGMLHSDDGSSAPIPLMKNGRYTAQAIDLSMTGRVGFGRRTFEESRAEAAKERLAEQQFENLTNQVTDELQNAIGRADHVYGLQLEAGEVPVEKPTPKRLRAKSRFTPPEPPEPEMYSPERETERAVQEGYAAVQEAQIAEDKRRIDAIGAYIEKNDSPAWDLIQQVAKNSGLTPDEVIQIRLEQLNGPDTLEGKIDRLKAGDTIPDTMGLPWVVQADGNGTLYLRKGNGARIHINKFNPSDDVRRIVGRGEVVKAPGPAYTPTDIERAAFEAPYITRRLDVIEDVKQRATGEVKDPETKTPEQAQEQVVAAESREDQVKDAAVEATEAATNPAPKATDTDVDEAISKAEELRKVAESAARQTAEAKGRAAGPGDYPRKASISSKGFAGREWAVGNSSHVKTDAGDIPIHLELVQPGQLTASFKWVGNDLVRVDSYPEQMQDVPPNEETRVQLLNDALPGNYEVDQYLDPGYGYSMGPAIVDIGGDVAGGNRRFLRMEKYLETIADDKVALAQFKGEMKMYAAMNGMTYPAGEEIYIPVRMMDEPIETIAKATELGSLLNKPVSHGIDESAKSITYGRLLYEAQRQEETEGEVGILDRIANEFNSADTPRDAMANNPKFFADAVKKYFNISAAENMQWFSKLDSGEYVLTVSGKEKLEKALLATTLKNPSTLDSLRNSTTYQSMLKAIGPLTRLRAIPDKDIVGVIEEAIQATAATERKKADGDSPKGRWNKTFAERDMFSEEPQLDEPNRMVEAIWRALNDRKTTRFKNALNDYLVGEGVQKGFFDPQEHGIQTPADLFNLAFEPELKEVRDARGLNTQEATSGKFKDENASGMRKYLDTIPWELTNDDFKAALENRPMSEAEEKKAPVEKAETEQPKKAIAPPPVQAETTLSASKEEKGYVTPEELEKFVFDHPSTKGNAPEVMRTARMMAEYVYDLDPPEGVDKKDALGWVLRERLAGLESTEDAKRAGSYRTAKGEERFGKGILALHKAANPTTFIHEFAHVVFPLLSEEDMRAINMLEGKSDSRGKSVFPKWDGKRGTLNDEVFNGVSEKFAGGLERFLRDENPTGFTAEVKMVLAKVKAMFVNFYKTVAGDPLSPFELTEEAKGVFADMFGITDFDPSDDFKKERDKARKAEVKKKKGIVKPEEMKHPVQDIATEFGAKGIRDSMAGKIEDTFGDRVDPSKPTAVLFYPSIEEAVHGVMQVGEPGSKIQDAELIAGEDGSYGIRFNVEKPVPKNILYQDVPKRNPALELEDAQKRLNALSPDKVLLSKVLRIRIEQLKAEIRSKYGVDSPKNVLDPEMARRAVEEVKNGKAAERGRQRVSDIRGIPHGPSGFPVEGRTGRISRPPVMGMPRHEGSSGASGGARPGGNPNLANVTPVKLEPLANERGPAVGILAGDVYDEKAWRDGLKKAGLPLTTPPPTVTLSRETAKTLKYAGQKQSAQTVLSALEQGDGAVLASSTGSGKTHVELAVAKETILNNPDAKILLITKNRGLLKDAAKVAKDSYDLELENDTPEGSADKNLYGASYQRLLNDPIYAKTQWDLVIADEAGEARNWHQAENQQGKLLMDVMRNSKKGVYVSATPFHSPQEYGYLEKLNLWPKGGFEQWVADNFAHEKIGDKVVAKLDPVKQAKLRQQMIERGQMVSQQISYDGLTIHFGVVPVTNAIEMKMDRIHQGVAVMRRELLKQGKKGLSERVSAFEATYTKAYLERSRLAEAIQLTKRAMGSKWQVIIGSENTSEDLFRRPIGPNEEAGTYRQLDEETGGIISKIMPEFPNIMDELRSEFGDEIVDYSGSGNTDAQREAAKEAFMKGEKHILYTTYAAGGIGVSLHDTEGDKPRAMILLGPPYSGVLLEQMMGRPWRFGTKSNVRIVLLATDSEPDIRLMATKVGPRMRALRASVLGERDSLAAVMANYTDEEKMREHQDMMAYSEQGNEVKVDAQGFRVRSKRRVNFDNWSAIDFPNATEAMHKGMQVEMSGGGVGSDWVALYQEAPKRWEPPNRPLTLEDIRIKHAVNAAADAAAKNRQIPTEDIAMTAVRAEDVAKSAPEGVDKEASVEGVMKTLFRGQVALQEEGGGWTVAHDAVKNMAQGVRGDDERPWKRRLWDYQFSQDSNIVHTLRKLGKEDVGWGIVNMREDFYQKEDQYDADHLHDLLSIFTDNKLNPHDENTVRKIIDVVEGHQAVADPAINKAAGELSEFMKRMRDFMAEKNVSLVTKDGKKIPYKNIAPDPRHIPHFINYDAKLTDPVTGETKTLREVMGHTFGELDRLRYMEEYARKIGKPVEEARVWIADLKKRMKGARLGQVRAERSMNVPFYYKDFDHLVKYVNQVSTAASMEETFGGEMEKLKKEIAKIPNDQARRDVLTSFTTMFEVPDWNTTVGKIIRKGQGLEALTKMPLSVLKVPFHLVHAVMKVGPKSVAKAGLEWLKNPNEFRDEKYQLGVVGGRTDNAWILEGEGDHGLGGKVFKETGFDNAYRWVRGIAGESAKVYMEQRAIGGLKKGGSRSEEVRRVLKHTMLIGDHAIDEAIRTGKWSEDDLEKAQRAFANKVTFNSRNPGQMPELSRLSIAKELGTAQKELNMALRGTYVLQSFSIKTYSFLRDALYDEVVIHHNMKPLIPFLLLYPVAGQLITGTTSGTKHIFNLTSEKIQGKGHDRDSWDNWLQQFDDLKHHPIIGAFKIWLDGACVAAAMERTKRVADLVLLMAEGHKKQADDIMKYWINDELEQDFGSIYTDMLYFAKSGTDEGCDLWKYSEDHAKQLTATEKHFFGELEKIVPLSKTLPYVDDMKNQYIRPAPKKWPSLEGEDEEPPVKKRSKWAAPTPWSQ